MVFEEALAYLSVIVRFPELTMSFHKLEDPKPDLRAGKSRPKTPFLSGTILSLVPSQNRSLSSNFPLTFSALEIEAIRRAS